MSLIETARTPIWIADGRRPGADSPVVLLVHGAAASRLDWSADMRHLRAGVIAVDLPGHGKSPPPGRSTIADYATDLIALLDALHIDKAVLIGHSMGGAIVMQMALDHAARVSGIVLIGTGAKLPIHPDIMSNAILNPGRVARMITQWSWASGADEAKHQQSYDAIMATSPKVMHGDFVACAGFDARPRLAEIRVPTLVIGAEQDQMMPVKFSQYLHDNITGSSLVMVEKAGHKLILERSEVVAQVVQNWLDQIA